MRMKVVVATLVAGIGMLAAVALLLNRENVPAATGTNPAGAPATVAQTAPAHDQESVAPVNRRPSRVSTEAHAVSQGPDESTADSPASSASTAAQLPVYGDALCKQAVDTLVSPNASYPQKQQAWKQLADSGKLDSAIAELEQRAANNPQAAEYPATLGQAYLQKCSTIQDVREQGILAMKADQVFDAALNIDPSNWDARFTKAVAMSYWPTQMNKGTEVMQHFSTLIDQQEARAPQPQFAQSYLWLGKEYEKYGYNDDAKAIWQRGAALFPNDAALKEKLSALATK